MVTNLINPNINIKKTYQDFKEVRASNKSKSLEQAKQARFKEYAEDIKSLNPAARKQRLKLLYKNEKAIAKAEARDAARRFSASKFKQKNIKALSRTGRQFVEGTGQVGRKVAGRFQSNISAQNAAQARAFKNAQRLAALNRNLAMKNYGNVNLHPDDGLAYSEHQGKMSYIDAVRKHNISRYEMDLLKSMNNLKSTQEAPARQRAEQERIRALKEAVSKQGLLLNTPNIFMKENSFDFLSEQGSILTAPNVFATSQNIMRTNRPNVLQTAPENKTKLNFFTDLLAKPRSKKW